ncbi:ribosomal protein S18-alanine N-acetyltransferase [Bifidobacterium thermophilum]|uniref:ribosomal protein S18-alanine N-acetyltransferase n=1 Tax=Bifidobacterium thermophilum TaxID=33905 RepID=UPI00309F9F37
MIVDYTTLEREPLIATLAALEHDLFGRGAWTPTMIRQELAAPARTYLIDLDTDPERTAQPGTLPIRGYAGYWYDGDDAEIMTIGVARAHQGQGIATRLLGQLVDRARTQGARRILLEVRVDNTAALALYRHQGFTTLGRRKRYYQPDNVDAYTMALDLTPHIAGFALPDGGATTAYDMTRETP